MTPLWEREGGKIILLEIWCSSCEMWDREVGYMCAITELLRMVLVRRIWTLYIYIYLMSLLAHTNVKVPQCSLLFLPW